MASNISRDEKRRLINERQSAVRKAWKEEQQRVANGKGTRDWNSDEQKELIERGSVRGYEGHHMKSVKEYPQEAGNPKNIQFLTDDEHFNGAHQGNFQNSTNGYYDPETQTMYEFDGDELIEIPDRDLSNPCYIDGVEQTTPQKEDVDMSENVDSLSEDRNSYLEDNDETLYDESQYDEGNGDSLSEDRNSYSEDNDETLYDEFQYDEGNGDSLSEDRNSYLEDNDETLDINESSDEYSQGSVSDEGASYSDNMSDSYSGETETSSESMSSSSGVDSGDSSSSSSESSSCSSESSGMGM